VLTFVAFLPVLHNGFVDWDDEDNFLANPHYRGLGWAQLRWMFTTFHMGPYQPLSWVTLGLDYSIWGMNPVGYHLTNLVLHIANAVVFYFICRRLLSVSFSVPDDNRPWGLDGSAAFGALYFAIHPLRVESVAWATERRDVVSGFFFLWTIYCYLRSHSSPRDDTLSQRWLRVALVTYVLSLLAKATAMTLPVILLLLDIYPLRRLNSEPRSWWESAQRGVLREKVPFVVSAIAFAIVALVGQQQSSALRSLQSHGVGSRIAQAFFGASFYLCKTLVPVRLSPLYEILPSFSPWDPAMLAGGALTIGVTVVLFFLRHRWPAGLACWTYSVVTLAPVLGFVSIGPQLVAERYSYLACLSWAVLAGGVLFYYLRISAVQNTGARLRIAAYGAAMVVFSVFVLLTWRQTTVWHDTGTLWSHVLEVDPNSSIAHYNLGRYLAKQGKYTEAISHYRQALRIRPDDADTHNNMGLLLAIRGQIDASLEEFQIAAQIDPKYARAFFNMGRVFARQGDLEKAIQNYQQALKLEPNEAEIHLALGTVLAQQGRQGPATMHFQEAVKLNPDLADAHVAFARSLAAQGKKDEAEKHYREALRLLRSQNRILPSP
jgi:Tfp pilus assembly protein PilF